MTNYQNLPEELKRHGLFCLWKYEERDGARTKVPYNPRTGGKAQPDNAGTFTTFSKALTELDARQGFDGIGMGVFGGFSAIDIDDCLDEHGAMTERAADIIARMDTYTEKSPSGRGVRLIFKASGFAYDRDRYYINRRDAKGGKAGLEIYIEGMTKKYLTVTGDVMTAVGIEERADRLPAILDDYMLRPISQDSQKPIAAAPVNLSHSELLEKARRASNGDQFAALYDRGDIHRHDNDESAADLALCNMLAFWTGCDALTMDSLFRASALMRAKWDRPTSGSTYGAITIDKAIRGCHAVYDPEAMRETRIAQDFNEPITEAQPEAVQAPAGQEEDPEQKRQRELSEYWQANGAGEYLFGYMDEVLDRMSRPPMPTGFKAIDEALGGGLRDGLIVFGAVSSLGKTTFSLQLADQIASSGRDVLFFSMEQSKFELVSKSISRMTYIRRTSTAKAATQGALMDGRFHRFEPDSKRHIAESMAAYQDSVLRHLAILEESSTGERFTVKDIRAAIQRHIDTTGNRPVVFVDYLQIIKPLKERATTKENTDEAVTELRRISRAFKIPVFVISSLNRENYTQPINLSSFKESGGIEYSADVVLGLQVEGADQFVEKNKAGNNAKVQAVKAKEVRNLELKILKQRSFKTPDTPFPLRFWGAYSHYEEGTASTWPT